MSPTAVSKETTGSYFYNICSRQEKGPDLTWALHRLVQAFPLAKICSISQVCLQAVLTTCQGSLEEFQNHLNVSKKTQDGVALILPRKRLKTCLTVFFEDLSLEHLKIGLDNDAITKKKYLQSPSYLKAYFITSRFREGAVRLTFWQYLHASKASVTIVKDEHEGGLQIKTFKTPDSNKVKYSPKFFPQLKTDDIDLSIVSLSELAYNQCKLSRQMIQDLHEVTGLPRNKLELRPIKVPPNSVTMVACPGRRRWLGRSSNRNRQRQQNTQSASAEREPQTTQTASAEGQTSEDVPFSVQVTSDDGDLDRAPSLDRVVTSMEPIFRGPRLPPMTTNLMSSLQTEERLASRRQGSASVRVQTAPLRPPRYPDFGDSSKRIESFATWPQGAGQDPTHMANHGFFYTGRLDLVRCFQCGIGMKDWTRADEPLYEHVRHSPECSFLLELLGPELLATYKISLIPAGAQLATSSSSGNGSQQRPASETDTRQGVADGHSSGSGTTSAASSNVRSPQFSTLDARIQTFRNGWPSTHSHTPEQLSDAGFYFTGQGDICRCFTCDGGLQRWDANDDPWVEHARWFPTCDFVIQSRGEEFVDLVQRAANQEDSEDEDPAVVMQPNLATAIAGVDDLQIQPEEEIDPAKLNDPEYLQKENERLRSILKCIKCDERDANMLFIPCTHRKMCEECAKDALVCPSCNRDIEKKVKTYMA